MARGRATTSRLRSHACRLRDARRPHPVRLAAPSTWRQRVTPRLVLCAFLAFASGLAAAPAIAPADVDAFVREMTERHGFDADALRTLLAQAEYRQGIIDAMNRPYEGLPWYRYQSLFVTPERIEGGSEYWRENQDTLARAHALHGVDPSIIVAIIGVETNYGRNLGQHAVIDALTTLGFAYPRRARFFRGELESFLLLAREEGMDPLEPVGSYAGAMGKPQFIPSSYRAYAIDFDGDGRRDLWNSDADAIGSVANYLARHGWQPGAAIAFPVDLSAAPPPDLAIAEKAPLEPNTTLAALTAAGLVAREAAAAQLDPTTAAILIRLEEPDAAYWIGLRNFYVITRYNHSTLYAMAVYQLSQAIRARVDGSAW
ncbi:lytic murein transglycosylase B [Thiocapsa imhoffii]|uniref:Lytic murein transglycosylase B n=2 Tax=Thiocapsa imhoffii TaxID=382777 RepID=A0A9X0WKY4_9GAMM|nr:lytic murein transglycosylase B [Thiocapsa imhoffii]